MYALFKRTNRITYLREFEESKWQPLKVQEKVLYRILQKNKKTKYGIEHNFSKIKTIEEFRKQVQINSYENLKPYIELIKKGEQNILTKDKVLFFAVSSGTTSAQKYIPITKERTKIFKRELMLWSKNILDKNFRGVSKGKTLYFAAAEYLGETESKIPYGNITGYHVKHLPWFIKKKVVLNVATHNIKDVDRRTKRIAEKALAEKNISQLAFAAPIEILLFLKYIQENKTELIKLVKKTNSKRGKELEELDEENNFEPKYIWPNIKLISCIKAKINDEYLKELYKELGQEIPTRDPGIYASEGRINLGLVKEDNAGVLVANTNFFEFEEQTTNGFEKPITIEKIEQGKKYKVLITTPEGLYRYDIGDIIEVIGFKRKLPIVKYADRDNYINIVGENLSEIALLNAIHSIIKKEKLELRGFTAAPYMPNGKEKPRYELMVESKKEISKEQAKRILEILEEELKEHGKTYYKARNEFGRLDAPLLSILVEGSYDELDKERISRSGQAKPMNISKDPEFRKRFKIIKTYTI